MSDKRHILIRKTKGPSSVVCADFVRKRRIIISSAAMSVRCAPRRVWAPREERKRAHHYSIWRHVMQSRAEQSKWTTNWSRKLRTEEVVFGSPTGSWTGDLLFWAWAASSSIAVDGPEGPCSSYLLPPSVLSILGPWQGWMGRMAVPQHSLSRLQCRRGFRSSPPPPLAQPAPSSEPPSGTSARQGIPLRPTPWSHSYLHRFVPPQ